MKNLAVFAFLAVIALTQGTFAVPTNVIYGAAWSESIIQDYDRVAGTFGNLYLRSPHQNIAPVGNFGTLTPEQCTRAVHMFAAPTDIRSTYPGHQILSATLYVDLWWATSSWNGDVNIPGIDAFHIAMTQNSVATNVIVKEDFWTPIRRSLGVLFDTTGATLPEPVGCCNHYVWLEGARASGEYAIDVTQALRDEVVGANYYFPVRLQVTGEFLGIPLDDNLNRDYVFVHASVGATGRSAPRLEVLLDDEGPPFTEISVSDTSALQFDTVDNVRYGVESSTNMVSGDWVDLGYEIIGDGGPGLAFDPAGIDSNKDYRIVVK